MSKKTTFLILCLIATTNLFAQKVFEGHISYSFQILGENSEMAAGMMPTSMEFYSNKKNTLVKMEGGLLATMMGDMLATSKESYQIKHEEKIAYVIKKTEPAKNDGAKVVKEDEVITLQGLSCQKYKVTKTDDKGEQLVYIWISTDYILPLTGGKGTENLSVPGVPGMAMKIMSSQMGLTVVITATEMQQTKQDKKYFSVPKGYAKKDFVPGEMGM